ncbi:S8 family serine peptidase [candidate division KSB1 bacterium]|nr:S8 family serine peptidase [candidate division KSB1 bacterium]
MSTMNLLSKSFILFCLLMNTISGAAAHSLLVKLAAAPSLAKGTFLATTGSAAVDAVFAHYDVMNISAAFPFHRPHAESNDLNQWVVVELPDHVDAAEIAESLTRAGVLHAHPNRAFQLHFTPNDPFYQDQYALKNVCAEQAWETERGSTDVIVAVIDTGIDYEHPDMQNNLWLNAGEDVNGNGRVDESDYNGIDDDGNGFVDDIRGWDFTDAPNYPDGGDYLDRDNDPMDGHGHGTGVAGIIAAETDNDYGIAGLAFGCRVMNLRAFNSSGYGEEDDAASAILYAIANGAQVINMSFGDVFVSRILDDVLKYGRQQGAVMVASAGNSSSDEIHYPSGFAETISVGASDQNDHLAGFSNFGPSIDLVAPGSSILSLDRENDFHNWNGTSFSAPCVSAAAALILSHRPGLNADAVRSLLVNSADDLGDPGWDDKFGAGRLQVARALALQTTVLAHISSPRLDSGFSGGPIDIHGSAWAPDFSHYDLFYGADNNPAEWTAISIGNSRRIVDDLLATWDDIPHQEGEYTLKIVVTSADHVVAQHTTRIFLDWSAPIVENLQFLPMLDGDKHSILLQADVDDLSEGSLYCRTENNDFTEIPLTYRTKRMRYNLSQNDVEGQLDLWLKVTNGAGLQTILDADGACYRVDLASPPIDVTRYSRGMLNVPFGRALAKTSDFNQNGIPELIMSVTEQGAIGRLALFEWVDGEMTEIYATVDRRIPRDTGDSDGDGRQEVLCGFGFNSYIYEAENAGGLPNSVAMSWEGDGATQFWASRFADLDQDGRGEVIMRVIRPQDQGATDQFQVFESTGDNEYQSVAALPNPTGGENFNGIPRTEVGDFDGDGASEILLGDSDGDIYIYENCGDDQYQATWDDDLPLLDSIDFIAAGDFDGDGLDEFIAGCHSDPNLNTEHDYDARHWYYRIYDQFGNDDYRQVGEWRLFGYESTGDFLSSVAAGDIDNDGVDEIFITAYPDFYLIDYIDNSFQIVYHHAPVQMNAAIVADADYNGKNELWLGDGDRLAAFDGIGSDTAPATPVALKARPLNESTVQLSWRAVAGAKNYHVYRGLDPAHLTLLCSVAENHVQDNDVEKDRFIFYAVKAVDPARTPAESRLSQIVSARPGDNPLLLSVSQETGASIRLSFSTAMNQTAQLASHYIVDASTRPTSAAHDQSGRHLLLTFARPFAVGEHVIHCSNLFDQYDLPLDSTSARQSFAIKASYHAPYIVAGVMPSGHEIELSFDQAMQKSTVEDIDNYSVNGQSIVSATTMLNPMTVHIKAEDLDRIAAADDTILVRVHGLVSENGQSVKYGRGDAIALIVPPAAGEKERVKVYPNPLVMDDAEAITFANLQQGDQVQILTSRGQLVKTLRKNDGDGDLEWDLTNERGDVVASGIYLYRISGDDTLVLDKLAIVR